MLRVANALDSLSDDDVVVLTYLPEENNRIIGYALLKYIYKYDEEYWINTAGILHNKAWKDYIDMHSALYLYQIAISKECQKRSVGKLLINDIISFFHFQCTILSNVSVKNEPSLKLHRYFNFKEVGIYERDDFGGEMNYKSYLLSYEYRHGDTN